MVEGCDREGCGGGGVVWERGCSGRGVVERVWLRGVWLRGEWWRGEWWRGVGGGSGGEGLVEGVVERGWWRGSGAPYCLLLEPQQ